TENMFQRIARSQAEQDVDIGQPCIRIDHTDSGPLQGKRNSQVNADTGLTHSPLATGHSNDAGGCGRDHPSWNWLLFHTGYRHKLSRPRAVVARLAVVSHGRI